jgi:putative flippase GtrA
MGNSILAILQKERWRQLILYGIIGSFSAFLDFLVYTALVSMGLFYIHANCISVLVGIGSSFLLNRHFNFKVKDAVLRRFVIFLIIGLAGLLLSNLVLYGCIEWMGIDKLVSKLLSIILVALFQFVLNKYITFKPTAHE